MKRLCVISAVSVALITVSLTACNAQKVGDSAGPGVQGSTAPLFNELPSSVKAAGVLKVGLAASAEPFAIIDHDGRTIVGVDPDLARGIEQYLGVPVDLQNIAFDQSVPSVNSHRVDAYWTWTSDTPVKRQQVDIVDFATTGSGIMVRKGNPQNITAYEDLCGKTVAAEAGADHVQNLRRLSEQTCIPNGKPAVTVLTFDSIPAALLQIKQGRADAVVTAYAVCAYTGKQSPDYDLAGAINNPVRAGIVVAKDRTDIRDVLRDAVQRLIDSGEYGRIMDKWGVGGAAISKATINDPA